MKSERRLERTRLLVLDVNTDQVSHRRAGDLVEVLRPNDWLVVNSAATLPSSFFVRHERTSRQIEIRLASALLSDSTRWLAVGLGEGNWRTPTENRPLPPKFEVGDRLIFDPNTVARIERVRSEISTRLLEIRFELSGAELWQALYKNGRSIQYSYLESELENWDQQTIFSGQPIAVEPPSAGFAFTWDLIFRLKKKGVKIRSIAHATGLSDTGDENLNRALPFPETFVVEDSVGEELSRARERGERVIALGTGVVRALESWARRRDSNLVETRGVMMQTKLKLHAHFERKLVDGLITGLHEIGASHLDLVGAFLREPDLLERGYLEAQAKGYLWHEYGDISLIA